MPDNSFGFSVLKVSDISVKVSGLYSKGISQEKSIRDQAYIR